jgi:hypothetical protein
MIYRDSTSRLPLIASDARPVLDQAAAARSIKREGERHGSELVSPVVKDQALRPNRNAILLTGATGLVGGLLLRRLADENANRIIYALVRRPEATAKVKNTHFVLGDMTQPGLGMREDVYSQLAESIDTIVHCAASTKFTLPVW